MCICSCCNTCITSLVLVIRFSVTVFRSRCSSSVYILLFCSFLLAFCYYNQEAPHSFLSISLFLVISSISSSPCFYICACANICLTQQISTAQAQRWCQTHNSMPYVETSAKTAHNVDEAFNMAAKMALERIPLDEPYAFVSFA